MNKLTAQIMGIFRLSQKEFAMLLDVAKITSEQKEILFKLAEHLFNLEAFSAYSDIPMWALRFRLQEIVYRVEKAKRMMIV